MCHFTSAARRTRRARSSSHSGRYPTALVGARGDAEEEEDEDKELDQIGEHTLREMKVRVCGACVRASALGLERER